MRLFIAVPVADDVRKAASSLIAELSRSKADAKWVAPEDMHLTLSFLGETSEQRLPDISKAMDATAASHGPFEILFDKIGAFGAPSRPRIIWLGVGGGAKVLSKLAEELQSGLRKYGITLPDEPGREFTPHLTLGRVRDPFGLDRLDTVEVPRGLSCPVERLVLFQSGLGSARPRYQVVREAPLAI